MRGVAIPCKPIGHAGNNRGNCSYSGTPIYSQAEVVRGAYFHGRGVFFCDQDFFRIYLTLGFRGKFVYQLFRLYGFVAV